MKQLIISVILILVFSCTAYNVSAQKGKTKNEPRKETKQNNKSHSQQGVKKDTKDVQKHDQNHGKNEGKKGKKEEHGKSGSVRQDGEHKTKEAKPQGRNESDDDDDIIEDVRKEAR